MQQSGENKLLQEYLAGGCMPEEQAMIAYYIIYVGIMSQDLLAVQPNLDELRSRTVVAHIKTRKTIWPARIITVTAAIVILLGIGTLILFPDNNQPATFANDVNLGTDKAILTLLNETTIKLSDVRTSSLLNQLDIEVLKAVDGILVFKVGSKSNASGYNKITTPKGGQYKIVLSDGTWVWLNAASRLSYNTLLKVCRGERKVNIVGEAYIEAYKVKSVIGRCV